MINLKVTKKVIIMLASTKKWRVLRLSVDNHLSESCQKLDFICHFDELSLSDCALKSDETQILTPYYVVNSWLEPQAPMHSSLC